jgi:hypothetical protein
MLEALADSISSRRVIGNTRQILDGLTTTLIEQPWPA